MAKSASSIRTLSLDELSAHLANVRVTRGVREVCLHHTWAPTAAQYRGRATWEAIRRYHVEDQGWSDLGYHLGVAPDDTIWLLRPLVRQGAHVKGRNRQSIGVVLLGNFDEEDPAANGLAMVVQVLAQLLRRFHLTTEDIRFHREFSDKTCPGLRLDLEEVRGLVQKANAGPDRSQT